MSRLSINTPCPVLTTRDNTISTSLDETTTTLNFTAAFNSSRDVYPKRKYRPSVQFDIHEDASAANLNSERRRSSLFQPPRRTTAPSIPPQRQSTSSSRPNLSAQVLRTSVNALGQAPKRPSHRLSIVPESATKQQEDFLEQAEQSRDASIKSKRPLRRGTIYIPNDDTTMPSMYMGIFSPLKNFEIDSSQGQQDTLDLTGIAAQMAMKRGRRTSFIATAPRRALLNTSRQNVQGATSIEDRPGQGGGKENVPPGCSQRNNQSNYIERQTLKTAASRRQTSVGVSSLRDEKPSFERSTHHPVLSSQTDRVQTSVQGHTVKSSIRPNRSKPLSAELQHRSLQSVPEISKPARRASINPIYPVIVHKPRVPTRFVVPIIQPENTSNNHTLLVEDIGIPKLYEENWLGHQEIALTQLLNKLFTSAQPGNRDEATDISLTQELLAVYSSVKVALIHNRLQAGLLYGAISIPQDLLEQGDSLWKDVGRKQRFINLWLDTYNRNALEAGLEVITGRICRLSSDRRSGGKSPSQLTSKKRLHKFIETFLLRNEDARPDNSCRSRNAWSYQRTLLRSLMLIKALDLVKTSRSVNFSAGLFLPTASLKSSITVLQAVFSLLNPAAGDPIRALSYIDYTVSHVQYPLEEFVYNIENLAIDLRDGVRLTRLVELLLYPSAALTLDMNFDSEATTTIIMPAGDTVDFLNGQDWPLSQHLKYPCLSRTARIWNVQVALSAVVNIKGMENLIEGISAEDLVDGYREKTIRLLWALVGKCGLPSLVDWNDVEWETRRLQLQTNNNTLPTNGDYLDEITDLEDSATPIRTFESCKVLLKSWTRAITKSQGIIIRNFTTSFADGKIFEAILDVYEPILTNTTTTTTKSKILTDRLINLGCSYQFANIFSKTESTHVLDRDFVLAALAFLCSRLLTPTKKIRAATVIQRCWKKHWNNIVNDRKKNKKIVAIACADLVRDLNDLKIESLPVHVVADAEVKLESESHEAVVVKESSDSSFILPMDESVMMMNPMSPTSEKDEDVWLSL